MTDRPRHPVKELENLLRYAEGRGWVVSRGKGYYKIKCPCGAHMQTVHLSPSDPRYPLNKRKQIARICPQQEPEEEG